MKRILMTCMVIVAALCARAALPEGGPYTEVVDGIEWTFMVENGEAIVGTGFEFLPAIPDDTRGIVRIPSTLGGRDVTEIGCGTFSSCKELTEVVIPPSVTSIGDGAFMWCQGLTAMNIPSTVKRIGNYAFSGCQSLMRFSVDAANPVYKSVDALILTKDGSTVVACAPGATDAVIPNTANGIGDYAFVTCKNLTVMTIPSTVKSIGTAAFVSCLGLKSFAVDAANTAFKSAGGLLLTKNGTTVVSGAGGITSATIPNGVKTIGNYAFYCSPLEEVRIPSGVKMIGDYAFASSELENVTIPNGVTSIGERSFEGCVKMTGVTIPSSVKTIGDGAFQNTGLESVVIPNGVTSVGLGAFSSCCELTTIDIPSSVTSWGYDVFGSSGLRSVAFSDGATIISYLMFSDCEYLQSMSIPASMASIDEFAFLYCHALRVVHVEPGDAGRVRKMLMRCRIEGESTESTVADQVTIVEDYYPEPGPTPPGPEPEEGFEEAHTFNGLVYAGEVMCGIVQVTTGKRTAKDQVKVGGFVMLADGKKQTIKSVTEDIEGGKVNVETKAGKLGEMELEITDNGFTGSVGPMTVKSGDVGEDTGIVSGTLKMSYFDAKTNKLKTRSIKIGGVASGGEAAGTLTTKGEDAKVFTAEID